MSRVLKTSLYLIPKRYYHEYTKTTVGNGKIITETIKSKNDKNNWSISSTATSSSSSTSWIALITPVIRSILSDPEVQGLLKQGLVGQYRIHILYVMENNRNIIQNIQLYLIPQNKH